jgi:hypothetical protein
MNKFLPLAAVLIALSWPVVAQTPASTIRLVALNQPPCATLTPQSVLTAKVAYQIAAQEQSPYGFAVSIKFQGTDPRMTFSHGRAAGEEIVSRNDTLTITYPMAAIMQDTRLRRPITCYFYLHRNTSAEGRSTVIAHTPPIVFQECQ